MSSFVTPDEHEVPRITPAVRWIIALNVAIYFLQVTVLGDGVERMLGFRSSDLPLYWWKAITYMFVHASFLHIAANMYMLWLFGPRVEHAWSAGGFTRYYLWCGLGGWLAHLLFFRGAEGPLVGASGAIYGVMTAYAMRWPSQELYLFGAVPVKMKWLLVGYIGVDILFGVLSGNSAGGVAHFAHLGGAAAGFLYLRTPSGQHIDRLRQRVAQVPDVPDETPRAVPRSAPRPRERGNEVDEIVAKSKAIASTRRPPAPPVAKPPAAPSKKADDLNLVLDKISEQGLASLTNDERRLLEEMSKKLRDR